MSGLSSGFESNALGIGGGMGMGGFGGFGGIAPIGLIGLTDLFNRDKHRGDDEGCGKQAVLLAAIGNAKDVSVQEARGIGAAICDAEKTNLNSFYAQAIQAERNTAQLSAQAQAIAALAEKRLDDLDAAGVAQTAAILARINEAEVQRLRDELEVSRHGLRAKDLEISIQNTNTNVVSQLQGQLQAQAQAALVAKHDQDRKFDAIFGSFNQLNRNTQDVINFGTMAASANQANQQTTIK